MSTYMAKAGEVSRKWYIIDAAGKPLGRVAAKAADVLRGKIKPTFTPHVDCGDHVIIIIPVISAVLSRFSMQLLWLRSPNLRWSLQLRAWFPILQSAEQLSRDFAYTAEASTSTRHRSPKRWLFNEGRTY